MQKEINFSIRFSETVTGEDLYIIGSNDSLGNWDPKRGEKNQKKKEKNFFFLF